MRQASPQKTMQPMDIKVHQGILIHFFNVSRKTPRMCYLLLISL